VLAAATGQKTAARPAILSRVFWSAAAVFLFALLFGTLFREREYRYEARFSGTRDAAPAAVGRLLWVDNYVKLDIEGLPALPAGKAYQLWQIGPEGPTKPVPCATFSLNPQGELVGEDRMKYVVARSQMFALTVEPLAGSKSPTMPIFGTATIP
jgi:anti-sigma-K factor RskA